MRKTALMATFLIAVFLVILPILAQEVDMEPGTGAPVIEPNFGSDINTLNPIIVQDGPSRTVINRIFPLLVNFDPFTLAWEPGAAHGLAENWTISDDGLVYTFDLKQDYVWNDGMPVTAHDVVYFWEISEIEGISPNASFVSDVESMTALDDYTLEVVFVQQTCTSIDTLAPVYAVPRHQFEELFGDDYAAMADSEFNLNMPVSGLDFQFANYRPGEQVTLLAHQDYPDAYASGVIPEGYIYKTVTDQVVQMEQFFAGELTWIPSVPQAFQEEVRDRSADGEFQMVEYPAASIRFLAFNLADPTNPQPAFDEDGNAIDQGNHPILGDVRVRQALAYAMEFEPINQGAFFGNARPVASHVLPTSWAFTDDLNYYEYNAEMAGQLLDEAGFTDEDDDGIRECHGCLYAEEGTPLSFRLGTNSGNVSQEALYTILQDQWGDVGVDVDLQILDFNALVEELTGQTYDAIGLFWGFSVPDNPDVELSDTFTPSADVIGSGFNTGSYNNARVNELVEQARTLSGCDTAERAALYQEAFAELNHDLPWLWISTSVVMSAAQPDVQNWNPQAGYSRWNIDGWAAEPR